MYKNFKLNTNKNMYAKSKLRGHKIEYKNKEWIYSDTGELVKDKHNERFCGFCNKPNTKEGHDACLGTLPGLMNACCGHGVDKDCYVQFLDGNCIRGKDAIEMINILKKYT